MTEPLPNPQTLVNNSRIYGTVNIGNLAGMIFQNGQGDNARVLQIRESVRPYLNVSDNAALDQLLSDAGITAGTPTPTPAPAPTPPPLETLPPTADILPHGSSTLVFPPDWAPTEEKIAFYNSPEYLDWELKRAQSTAPTAGGDPIFDSYMQNAIEAFFANSALLGYQIDQQQRAAYENQLRAVQQELAQQGWHLTQDDLRTLAAGGAIEVRTSSIDPSVRVSTSLPADYNPDTDIVVTGGRAHLAPSFYVSSVIAQVPIMGTGGLPPAASYTAAQRAQARAFFRGKNPNGDDLVEYTSEIANASGAVRRQYQARIDDVLRAAEELYLAANFGPSVTITGPDSAPLTRQQLQSVFNTNHFQIIFTTEPMGAAAITVPTGGPMQFAINHPDWDIEASNLSSSTAANTFIFLHEVGHKLDNRVTNSLQVREGYANHWAASVGQAYGLPVPTIAQIQNDMGRQVQP